MAAATFAATLAFLIGLSRIYLIEHYLSDVLNGWLVGSFWLGIGVAVTLWMRERARAAPAPPVKAGAVRAVSIGLAVVALAGAAWQVATYDKARNVTTPPDIESLTQDVAGLITSGQLPMTTESIAGAALEPMNVVVIAKSRDELTRAMQAAGWVPADKPGVKSLARAALAAWTNQRDETAPVTPYFWRNAPNGIAFQKPTPEGTLRKRHHVRFWQSGFFTLSGSLLFFGAASFDDGLDWRLLHHIDPNVDGERDTLLSDLRAAGNMASAQSVRTGQPRLGQSVAGDPWFTDGKTVVITLQ